MLWGWISEETRFWLSLLEIEDTFWDPEDYEIYTYSVLFSVKSSYDESLSIKGLFFNWLVDKTLYLS